MRTLITRLPVMGTLLAVAAIATWTGVSGTRLNATLVEFSGTTHCTGTLAPGEYDKVQVDDNQTCTMTQANTVEGNVTVEEHATLNDLGGIIKESLNVDDGGNLVTNSGTGYGSNRPTIEDNLDADGPASLQVRNTDVGGDLSVSDLEGGNPNNFICSSTVGDDLTVKKDDKTPASPIDIGGSSCSEGGGNTIHGNAKIENERYPVDFSNNTVGHDLTVKGNEPGGATVDNNSVGHDADCHDNSPFSGSGNTAPQNDCNGTASDS